MQNTNWLSFWGVKINLTMILVLILSLFLKNFWQYAVIALTAAWILKTAPLLGVFLAAFYFKKYLTGKLIVNSTALILSGTFIFYLLSDPGFLIKSPLIFIQELIYNLAGGWILLLMLEKAQNSHHEV